MAEKEKKLVYSVNTQSQFTNLECEIGILAILFDHFEYCYDRLFIKETDFAYRETKMIFKQIIANKDKVETTPYFFVTDYNKHADSIFDQLSPASYLFDGYQKILREHHLRREIERCASQKESSTHYQEQLDKLYSKDEERPATAKEMEDLWKSDGSIRGVSTGFDNLDEYLIGFENGSLYTIGARAGMGKTSCMTSMIYNLLIKKLKIACFSFEMDQFEITTKLASIYIKKSFIEIKKGGLPIEQRQKVLAMMDVLDKNDSFNIFTSADGKDVDTLIRKAKLLKREGNLDVIFIDYVGLMSDTSQRFQSRAYELASITGKLKMLAQTLQVPVVMLAQINRGVEARENKRPMMSDLRDSGSIEQDSNAVIIIYRSYYYLCQMKSDNPEKQFEIEQAKSANRNKVELIIAKNRQGETATVEMGINLDCMEFINVTN